MDFKGFKKVQEDDKMATMAHPSGHEVRIVKSSLSGDLLKRLKELPLHQAKGTQAEDYTATEPEAKAPDQPDQSPGHTTNIYVGGQAQPGLPAPEAPVAKDNTPPLSESNPDLQPDSPPQEQPQSAGGAMPMAPQAPSGDNLNANINALGTQPAFALGQQAASGAKSAAETAGSQQAAAFAGQQRELQAQAIKEQQHAQAYLDESRAAADDIKKGHIQPNHYLESKSTLGKIGTALGLMLGGYGAGLTHGPNMAQQFLQSQIERDLEAQKANLGSKENLLSALNSRYHNQQTADNMYRSIMLNRHADQLQEIAAKNNINMALPQYQQTLSGLVGPAQDMARKASLLDMQSRAEGVSGTPQAQQDQDAQRYLQAARVIDPKQAEEFEKRYVPGTGTSAVPLDPKDREFLQKNTELKDLYSQAQDVLKGSGKVGTLPLTADRAKAQSIQNQMQLKMGELAGLSRFTPEENKIYQQTVPDLTGTHFTGQDKAKLDSLMQSVNGKLNTFYTQKGIGRSTDMSDKVTVIDPSGKSGSIPKANLQRALKLGYKQAQ